MIRSNHIWNIGKIYAFLRTHFHTSSSSNTDIDNEITLFVTVQNLIQKKNFPAKARGQFPPPSGTVPGKF